MAICRISGFPPAAARRALTTVPEITEHRTRDHGTPYRRSPTVRKNRRFAGFILPFERVPVADLCRAYSEYRPCGESAVDQPANTEPAGKSSVQSGQLAGEAPPNKPPIPTLWGKNTDLGGNVQLFDGWRRTVSLRFWSRKSCFAAAFQRRLGLAGQRRLVTDPVGRQYRPCGEAIPTLRGDFYRSIRENIPILVGDFTDPAGADYRPVRETLRTKMLQIKAFVSVFFVYMMFCLCLMFCLVNREVRDG